VCRLPSLASTIHFFFLIHTHRQRAVSVVEPYIEQFESKNAALIELLKRTRKEELICKEKIDAVSLQTEKAKKTAKTAQSLSENSAIHSNQTLQFMREQRSQAIKELENILGVRTAAQNQIMNLSTIVAEMRADVDKRNYRLMYKQVNSSFFLLSFGKQEQIAIANLIKQLSGNRRLSEKWRHKAAILVNVIAELRNKITHVVSLNWK